ncbi:hypothetical protein LEMLEM_LOCUS9417 [Lemmus lemmus]
MPKPHRRRRVDRWLPGIKPEGWLACEEVALVLPASHAAALPLEASG